MVANKASWFVGVDMKGIERYGERILKDNKVFIQVYEPPKNPQSLRGHVREYEVKPTTVRELTV